MSADAIWEDREVKFDVALPMINLRAGEKSIDVLSSVEDTKGNNGERGLLVVTNLRIIWYHETMPKINLSIGWNCVLTVHTKVALSRQRGNTEAIFIMTRAQNTKFEFIFTNLVPDTPQLFTTVLAVHKAYQSSKMYRDMKLRSTLIQNKQLVMLPHEECYNKVNGVWNLSQEQGNLGTFFITNYRVVWYANLNEQFNVSIPYIQMKSVRVRESKFGMALVIETTQLSNGYVLGFRVDPVERLQEVGKEIRSLYESFITNPDFGVFYDVKTSQQKSASQPRLFANVEEDVDVDKTDAHPDVFAAYMVETSNKNADPVYCEELGLAVEPLPDGLTIGQLWDALAN